VQQLRRNNRIYCADSLEVLTDLACLAIILRMHRQSWEIFHNQTQLLSWLTKIPIRHNAFRKLLLVTPQGVRELLHVGRLNLRSGSVPSCHSNTVEMCVSLVGTAER